MFQICFYADNNGQLELYQQMGSLFDHFPLLSQNKSPVARCRRFHSGSGAFESFPRGGH